MPECKDGHNHVTVVTQDDLLVTMLGLCDLHAYQLLMECPETSFKSMCVTSEIGDEVARWHADKGFSHDRGRTWHPEIVNCALSAMAAEGAHFSTMEH